VTGGCDSKINQMLQNNAGGQFRVSTAVVVPVVSAAVLKRSPEISTPVGQCRLTLSNPC